MKVCGGHTILQRGQYLLFLSSLPLSPQLPRKCLAPTCHLSKSNEHCTAGAGLPIHMIGEILKQPKRKDERVGL
jgi:hypothetical protein